APARTWRRVTDPAGLVSVIMAHLPVHLFFPEDHQNRDGLSMFMADDVETCRHCRGGFSAGPDWNPSLPVPRLTGIEEIKPALAGNDPDPCRLFAQQWKRKCGPVSCSGRNRSLSCTKPRLQRLMLRCRSEQNRLCIQDEASDRPLRTLASQPSS